jgi:hypothetical protein
MTWRDVMKDRAEVLWTSLQAAFDQMSYARFYETIDNHPYGI